MDLLFVVVFYLATHRISKLITQDEFPPVWHVREWVLRRWPGSGDDDSWQGYLVTCMWCVSVYVAAGLALATGWVTPLPWWMQLLMIPAASGVTGLIAERSPD